MEKEKKQIELRSEKVRNIIGIVPPVLLRYGISIIGLAICVLVGISAIIPYQPTIDTQINVVQDDDGILHYTAKIPQKAIKDKVKFTEIIMETSEDFPLPTHFQIEKISDVVEISESDTWQTGKLFPTEFFSQNIQLSNPMNLSGKIMLEKRSVMRWLIRKITMGLYRDHI